MVAEQRGVKRSRGHCSCLRVAVNSGALLSQVNIVTVRCRSENYLSGARWKLERTAWKQSQHGAMSRCRLTCRIRKRNLKLGTLRRMPGYQSLDSQQGEEEGGRTKVSVEENLTDPGKIPWGFCSRWSCLGH